MTIRFARLARGVPGDILNSNRFEFIGYDRHTGKDEPLTCFVRCCAFVCIFGQIDCAAYDCVKQKAVFIYSDILCIFEDHVLKHGRIRILNSGIR